MAVVRETAAAGAASADAAGLFLPYAVRRASLCRFLLLLMLPYAVSYLC